MGYMTLLCTYVLIVCDQYKVCRFQLCKKSVGRDEKWHPLYEIRHFNAFYKLGTGVGAVLWF
jgi:hypothetical protein